MAIRISAKQAREMGLEVPRKPRKKDAKQANTLALLRASEATLHVPGRVQTLIIPGFHPVSVNTLLSRHWFRRSKIKKSQEKIVAHYAAEHAITPACGKRRITVLFTGWHLGGVPDVDNLMKCLLDNIKSLGLLIDDSAKWCESVATLTRSKEWITTITLEDIPNQ